MKVALIAPTYLPSRRANTVQVMKMAQALTAVGHRVWVCVPGDDPRLPWQTLAAHYGLQRRFPVVWLTAHPRLRRLDYALRAVLWARRWGAEQVYTRVPQAAALAAWLGMPTVFELHDLPGGRWGGWWFRGFLHGRGARRLVVISQALLDDVRQRFAVPPALPLVAPDGVDLERYRALPDPSSARAALGLPQRFTVGYTGHLYAGRGVPLILELAHRLAQVTFLLVGGEPSDVEAVRRQARTRGLTNLVLTGFVPNAELPRYQAACDVLLMPYQQRVAASSGGDIGRYLSPMKMFEYLACGRAILASDLPVLREVLTPACAVLLPPQDSTAWVKALQSLMMNEKQRGLLAQQARAIAARYTWEARARRIFPVEQEA